MIHRHIEDPEDLTAPGIEDVIMRGDSLAKERLRKRILENPEGPVAKALERVVNSGNEELGTYGLVWKRFLERARRGTIFMRRGTD